MTLLPPIDSRVTPARQLAAAGRWRDVCDALSTVVAHADLSSELFLLRGEAHLRVGDRVAARVWLKEAVSFTHGRHDRITERALLNQLGVACFELGSLEEAEEALQRALALGRDDEDDLLVARASNNIGMIANVRGQRDEAVRHYQLAIPAYQRLGHVRGLAETYHNLALTSRDQNHTDAADEYERRAMEFAQEAKDDRLLVMGEIGLAETSLLRGDAQLAERRARRAARRCRQLSDHANEADALRTLGAARLALDHLRGAGLALGRAVALARAQGAALNEAEALWERAKYHLAVDLPHQARVDAERALSIFERLRSPHTEAVRSWIVVSRVVAPQE
jgi:tetratricopeptide (TPR) repeat protein